MNFANSTCIRDAAMFHKYSVTVWATSHRRTVLGKFASGLMLFLWLGVFAAAASPELHLLLHSDARNANHNCVVTQIQHQPLLAGIVSVGIAAPILAVLNLTRPANFFTSSTADTQLPPGRAPPLIFSSSPVAG
jgi:hypothetical protein